MTSEIPKLFGTSGIRGKIGYDITLELAVDIGRAIASYAGGVGSKIVLGYDSRTSNVMMENAVTAGLLQCGCHVLKIGMAPTPLVGYATMKLKADTGVMITASHNPPEYNGIKLWNPDGMAYKQDQERTIEEIIYKKNFKTVSWENIGKVEEIKYVVSDYVTDIINQTNIKHGIKVVVDCANGAASYLSPLILRKVGCSVIAINSQPDGFFPGRLPEPSEKNLGELMEIVKSIGADIGIAHDGDADRMIAIDEKGFVADFDKLLALVCRESGGTVVTTVDASLCTDKCMDEVGGHVIRTKVGDVHVAEAIENNNAQFGGEPSGTWLHPNFCMCPDGILSALRVIELIQKYGPLSEQLDAIPNYPTIRDKVNCENSQKKLIMESVKAKLHIILEDVVDVNPIDGVRISMVDSSWVLIRPSGTESFIRITLEATTIGKAYMIRDQCKEFIEGLL
ncbi:MAG: phosphoglucosamine mutase [Methanobacterium sp.]|nr:phosphoglucosamine mutase [Methanobacterium sp.]